MAVGERGIGLERLLIRGNGVIRAAEALQRNGEVVVQQRMLAAREPFAKRTRRLAWQKTNPGGHG